jgi:hypothetical protein
MRISLEIPRTYSGHYWDWGLKISPIVCSLGWAGPVAARRVRLIKEEQRRCHICSTVFEG